MLLSLGEPMFGCYPKKSKLGGLPNCSYSPRKPEPLVAMIENEVEYDFGAMLHADVVQNTEQ